MPGIFVSHASADKALVDEFVDTVVRLGSEVPRDLLFYSSSSDAGVPSGEDLNSYIRGRVRGANLVLAIITPAFHESAFCLAELGAAWAAVGSLFPLCVPDVARGSLDGVLSGVALRSMADAEALDELHDRIKQATGSSPSAATWGQYRQRWLAALPRFASISYKQPATPASASPPSAAPSRISPAYEWGEMFDSFVDAALYLRDDGVARIEIEHHIRAGTVIPSRYHYSSDAGADNWLRLCREPTYRHHIVTTEFWADSRGDGMAALVVDELGSETFDLISLGPGDGQKDAELVDSWLAAGADVMYYPYDVSLPLASRAVQRVRDRAMGQRGDRLRIKAVLADFHHFSTMRRVFDHRPAPNVVALLGSLGNLSREVAFLRDLRDTLTPNDLVVIEVRLKSPRGVPEMDSKSSLQFDFGPLDYYLGIPFEENLVSVQTKQGVSAVPNTDTVVVGCGEILYKGETFRDVPLQYIHLYEADAFIQTLESTGFTIVESIVDEPGAFLECVVRPRESLVRRITGWRLGA